MLKAPITVTLKFGFYNKAEKSKLISVLLATYNWPEALSLCLQALKQQTDHDFEIIICDDGSKDETKKLIEKFRSDYPVKINHLWQEDLGFRKTLILNKGINAAKGDYLVFLDGDCIPQSDFIAQHKKLARENHLVTGSRILSKESITKDLCSTGIWSSKFLGMTAFIWGLKGLINKWLPLYVKLPDHPLRLYKRFEWRRIKGCNMACWKSDALAINGFDESLTGWGHEDADFVFRLQNNGVIRKSGAWATEVIHLWHKMANKETAKKNAAIVKDKILAKAVNKN
jgi:glycosyltransferase involved in cell wall biosynthesis